MKSELRRDKDGTLKCDCRYDFVILHNLEVQCSSCGESYGVLKRHNDDLLIISKKDIEDQLKFNRDQLSTFEMRVSEPELWEMRTANKLMVDSFKANIKRLKKLIQSEAAR